MAEIEATLQMMDRAIGEEPRNALAEGKPASEGPSAIPWFIGGGSILAVAGLTIMRIRAAQKG
jgi:hypothetical protein